MPEQTFTIIDSGRPVDVPARVDGERVWLSPEAVRESLGWELKPEGLCRGAVCIPLSAGSSPVGDGGVDLAGLAAILRRPIALDLSERAAYLGAPAHERSEALASLDAPDFTLPDLDGRPHSLVAYRGKKVLLIAYASW